MVFVEMVMLRSPDRWNSIDASIPDWIGRNRRVSDTSASLYTPYLLNRRAPHLRVSLAPVQPSITTPQSFEKGPRAGRVGFQRGVHQRAGTWRLGRTSQRSRSSLRWNCGNPS